MGSGRSDIPSAATKFDYLVSTTAFLGMMDSTLNCSAVYTASGYCVRGFKNEDMCENAAKTKRFATQTNDRAGCAKNSLTKNKVANFYLEMDL